MDSDNDIVGLKTQDFEGQIKHNDEVGPVGNLFESCVQLLRSLSTKVRELDAAYRRTSETGKWDCVTCRRRKKLCDQGKPECNNCVRGGFICEGDVSKSASQTQGAPKSHLPLQAESSNVEGSDIRPGKGTETFPISRQPLSRQTRNRLLLETLESNLATLLFWDDEFGALSGHLDKALEHSEENRDLTLSTLISLADFLGHDLLNATLPLPADREDIRQRSMIHARVDKARGIIMDTEAPTREETSNIEDVCETLDSKVARLNVLGPILEESIPAGTAFEQVASHGQLGDRPAHQYYADQISIKYPNASTTLVEVLGKCNWERYMRIHRKREENTEREGSPIGETENMSKFHDSGLGTSVPAVSAVGVPQGSFQYAETEVSKRAEASHRRLPPLPEEGRKGWPFLCEVCNSVVRIRRTNAWKKHVFSDVLAYVCIFDDCPSDRCFFEDRDALTAHLGNQHGFAPAWKSEQCPLCLEETGSGMHTISLHFARHMEEVALGAIPRTVESDAGSDESHSEASSETIPSDGFELDEESIAKGICPIEGCGGTFRDLKAHIITHMIERPLKCPITTCEYHLKGFARKYDQHRHTLTHYRGTMVCDFCPGSGSAAEKSFNRVDVFKRHLTSVHGVEQKPSNSHERSLAISAGTAGTCSVCSVTFANAQDFYGHLDDCILRVVQQADPSEAINDELASFIPDFEDIKTLGGHHLPNDVPEYTVTQGNDEENNSHQPPQDDLQQVTLQSNEGFNDAAKAESAADSTNTKARKRTKAGCLTCRKRRIRCGEERPFCNNCIRSKRQCEGYKQRVIFKPPIGDWPGSAPASTLPSYSGVTPDDSLFYVQSPQPTLSPNIAMPPPSQDVLKDRLQAAHQTRSKSPEYSSREISPFKQGSPLAPPSGSSDTLSSAQTLQATANQLRDAQIDRDAHAALKDFNCCGLKLDSLPDLLQHFEERHPAASETMQRASILAQGSSNDGGTMQPQPGTPDPRTISPKDTAFDYLEAEEDSVMPPLPGSSTGAHDNAHVRSSPDDGSRFPQ